MSQYGSADWMGREYAVETVRSLMATEKSDGYLMNMENMLETLASCAQGGPFNETTGNGLASPAAIFMLALQ